MIARKVHSLTKKQKKSHDCTKSSLFDKKQKKITFARKVPSLTKNDDKKTMISRKVHSLTKKAMIARTFVFFVLAKCHN